MGPTSLPQTLLLGKETWENLRVDLASKDQGKGGMSNSASPMSIWAYVPLPTEQRAQIFLSLQMYLQAPFLPLFTSLVNFSPS